MKFIAHSKKYCGREQGYAEHNFGVLEWVRDTLEKWRPFLSKEMYARIERRLLRAAENHDLGKLDMKNQSDMRDESHRGALTFPHQYAGARYLDSNCHDIFGAALIYGHHKPGLPNLNREIGSGTPFCGIFGKNAEERRKLQDYIDSQMDTYLCDHCAAMKKEAIPPVMIPPPASSLEERMMLSCLVNSDWNDTAGKKPDKEETPRRWKERLEKLDGCVADLSRKAETKSSEKKRLQNVLRQELYQECRDDFTVTQEAGICCGDACVGTGKTLSFLALALRLAIERSLRHIIIILPYINILTQTERILKETIVLEGENESDIVTAIHCRAEYEQLKLRCLEMPWESPVILTTAVTFYESLAANVPSKLRKLYELPGSAIILDEFHASAPAECLPIVWNWLGELSLNWGCPVILSSGTMVHFWENARFKEIYGKGKFLPKPTTILSVELQKKMESAERQRVCRRLTSEDMERCQFKRIEDLLDFVLDQEGPRIIMVETREAAARIAYDLKKIRGRVVYHLSNAFTAEDCGTILNKVEEALKGAKENPAKCDWTLVTTTYAAMGLNLSFRSGFCQIFSCSIYLQLIGRISRDEEYDDASSWAFELADPRLPENVGVRTSKEVWRDIIQDMTDNNSAGYLSPSELASFAFQEEGKRRPELEDFQRLLLRQERNFDFADMAQKFKVIPQEDNVLAVTDLSLVQALRHGKYCDRIKFQQKSISISKGLVKRLGLVRILENTDLYEMLPEQYDSELFGCFKTLVGEYR